MFDRWWRLFSGEVSHGEPIRLEFQCGHYLENKEPPVMATGDRDLALEQAARLQCWQCNSSLWQGLRTQGTYPEMQAITRPIFYN